MLLTFRYAWVLAGFGGRASAHMGYRRGEGDAIAQVPHEAGVQPLVPPERTYASHSILRRVGSALGALAVFVVDVGMLERPARFAFGKT